MNKQTDTAYIEKQANISIGLIIAIIIMVMVYMGCTYTSENDSLFNGAIMAPIVTVLLGIYTFTYRGKEYRTSRVLFIIFLIIGILSIMALYYIIGLAQAFQH